MPQHKSSRILAFWSCPVPERQHPQSHPSCRREKGPRQRFHASFFPLSPPPFLRDKNTYPRGLSGSLPGRPRQRWHVAAPSMLAGTPAQKKGYYRWHVAAPSMLTRCCPFNAVPKTMSSCDASLLAALKGRRHVSIEGATT